MTNRARRRQVRRAFRGGQDPVRHNLAVRIGWRAALFLDTAEYFKTALDRFVIAAHHAAAATAMVAQYHRDPDEEDSNPFTRKDHE